jgi:hypothetical protein
MAQIPTASDLGLPDVPVSSRPVLVYDAGIAQKAAITADQMITQGGQAAGAGVEKFGDAAQETQNKLETASAMQDFIGKKLDLDQAALTDKDYTTLPDRYRQGIAAAAQAAGANISLPSARAQFMEMGARYQEYGVNHVLALANTKSIAADRDFLTSAGDSSLDQMMRATDEPTRMQITNSYRDMVQGMLDKGSINQAQADTLNRTYVNNYAMQRGKMLINQDPVSAAGLLSPGAPVGGGASLAQFATGNAVPGGLSSVEGVNPEFASRISTMVAAMPDDIRQKFQIISGFRDQNRQAEVNPGVTNSHHTQGMAVDTTNDPAVLSWVAQNGPKFGVGYPLASDPKEANHLEPLENGQRVAPEQMAQWVAQHQGGGDTVTGGAPPPPGGTLASAGGTGAPAPASNVAGTPGTPLAFPKTNYWRDFLRPDQRIELQHQAEQRATALANANSADALRAQRLQAMQDKQTVEARTNAIWADAYSNNPQITAKQIAVDPAFDTNPERRTQMINLINNPPGSGIPPAQSYAAAQGLVDRIMLPYGDPDKITDPGQIYDQIGHLNRPDLEFTLKTLNDNLSPGREKFTQREKNFLDGVRPQIEKSGQLSSMPIDGKGRMKFYEFSVLLNNKIDAYVQANKDPGDLLDPSKPDYMGNPEVVKPFKRTMVEALADRVSPAEVGSSLEDKKPDISTVDLTTKDGIVAAYRAGKILRDDAGALLIQRGYASPNKSPNAPPPVSEQLAPMAQP